MPAHPLIALLAAFVVLPAVVAALIPSALWGRRLLLAVCCVAVGAPVALLLAKGHGEDGLLGAFCFPLVGMLLYVVSSGLYVWLRMLVQWWRRGRAGAEEPLPGLLLQADSEVGLSLHGEPLCTDADAHAFVLRLAGEDVRLREQKLPLRARMAGWGELEISCASLRGRLSLRRGVGFALELGDPARRVEKMLVRKKCGVVVRRLSSFEHEGWRYGFHPLRGCLSICGAGEPGVQELLIATAAWLAVWRFDEDLK